MVAGKIFIKYADEIFLFLFGRAGSFEQKGAYLSMVREKGNYLLNSPDLCGYLCVC